MMFFVITKRRRFFHPNYTTYNNNIIINHPCHHSIVTKNNNNISHGGTAKYFVGESYGRCRSNSHKSSSKRNIGSYNPYQQQQQQLSFLGCCISNNNPHHYHSLLQTKKQSKFLTCYSSFTTKTTASNTTLIKNHNNCNVTTTKEYHSNGRDQYSHHHDPFLTTQQPSQQNKEVATTVVENSLSGAEQQQQQQQQQIQPSEQQQQPNDQVVPFSRNLRGIDRNEYHYTTYSLNERIMSSNMTDEINYILNRNTIRNTNNTKTNHKNKNDSIFLTPYEYDICHNTIIILRNQILKYHKIHHDKKKKHASQYQNRSTILSIRQNYIDFDPYVAAQNCERILEHILQNNQQLQQQHETLLKSQEQLKLQQVITSTTPLLQQLQKDLDLDTYMNCRSMIPLTKSCDSFIQSHLYLYEKCIESWCNCYPLQNSIYSIPNHKKNLESPIVRARNLLNRMIQRYEKEQEQQQQLKHVDIAMMDGNKNKKDSHTTTVSNKFYNCIHPSPSEYVYGTLLHGCVNFYQRKEALEIVETTMKQLENNRQLLLLEQQLQIQPKSSTSSSSILPFGSSSSSSTQNQQHPSNDDNEHHHHHQYIVPNVSIYNNAIHFYALRASTHYGMAAIAEDWLMHMSKLATETNPTTTSTSTTTSNSSLPVVVVAPTLRSFTYVLNAWSRSSEKNGANRANDLLDIMIKLSQTQTSDIDQKEDHDDVIIHTTATNTKKNQMIQPDLYAFGIVAFGYEARNDPKGCENVYRKALDFFLLNVTSNNNDDDDGDLNQNNNNNNQTDAIFDDEEFNNTNNDDDILDRSIQNIFRKKEPVNVDLMFCFNTLLKSWSNTRFMGASSHIQDLMDEAYKLSKLCRHIRKKTENRYIVDVQPNMESHDILIEAYLHCDRNIDLAVNHLQKQIDNAIRLFNLGKLKNKNLKETTTESDIFKLMARPNPHSFFLIANETVEYCKKQRKKKLDLLKQQQQQQPKERVKKYNFDRPIILVANRLWTLIQQMVELYDRYRVDCISKGTIRLGIDAYSYIDCSIQHEQVKDIDIVVDNIVNLLKVSEQCSTVTSKCYSNVIRILCDYSLAFNERFDELATTGIHDRISMDGSIEYATMATNTLEQYLNYTEKHKVQANEIIAHEKVVKALSTNSCKGSVRCTKLLFDVVQGWVDGARNMTKNTNNETTTITGSSVHHDGIDKNKNNNNHSRYVFPPITTFHLVLKQFTNLMDLQYGEDIYRVYECIRELDEDVHCPMKIDYETFFLTLHGLRLHNNNNNNNNNKTKKNKKNEDSTMGQLSARVFLHMFELFTKGGRKELEPTKRCMDFCFESLLHQITKESVQQSIQILRVILQNHSNQTIQDIPSYYVFQSIIKACRECDTPELIQDANKLEIIMNTLYKDGQKVKTRNPT